MAEIFVSHSSVDGAAAATVAEALRQHGHRIFLDTDSEDGIYPGAQWSHTLFHKLRLCDVLVFLNSAGSDSSKWCHTEVAVASDLGKHCYWLDLAPGLSVPTVLQSVQGIRFTGNLADSIASLVDLPGGMSAGPLIRG
jgi:hypothetical protein